MKHIIAAFAMVTMFLGIMPSRAAADLTVVFGSDSDVFSGTTP